MSKSLNYQTIGTGPINSTMQELEDDGEKNSYSDEELYEDCGQETSLKSQRKEKSRNLSRKTSHLSSQNKHRTRNEYDSHSNDLNDVEEELYNLDLEDLDQNEDYEDAEFDYNEEVRDEEYYDYSHREITSVSKLTNTQKKTLRSLKEKYPVSIKIPTSGIKSSSTSLNSFSDNDNYEYPTNYDENSENNQTRNNLKHIFEKHTRNETLSNSDLNLIFKELSDIYNKLADEYQIINEKESELKKRETRLNQDEERLIKLSKLDSKLRFEELKLNYENELVNLRNELKEKCKENKRLSESYNMVKRTNDTLKKQLNEKHEKNIQIEREKIALNSRLLNLKKKLELNDKKKLAIEQGANNAPSRGPTPTPSAKTAVVARPTSANQISHFNTNILDGLAMLLEWISQVHLKAAFNFNLPFNNDPQIIEKSSRLLPVLADLIINLNKSSVLAFKKHDLAFLEFIYWSILHLDSSFQNKKINLSSTFRRIGEEIYKSYNKNYNYSSMDNKQLALQASDDFNEMKDAEITDLFLQSSCSKVRILSCFIILRTLNQADYIHNVFEILRQDLKEEANKDLFLNYFGTWTILKWCKINIKSIIGCCIDTYLQMSMDWLHLDKFLESCSNESWFSQISLLVKNSSASSNSSSSSLMTNSNLDVKIIEKLAVLFQKLSKIRSNKKYFDMFALSKALNDLLKQFYYENNFLTMNLKSIMFNLNEHNA